MMLDVHKVAQIIDHNTGLSSPDGDNSFVRVGMIKTGKTFDGHIEKSGSFFDGHVFALVLLQAPKTRAFM